MTSATFFTWLSEATFYEQAHAAAVALVPTANSRWLDVGTGPGVMARLAAERGFEVVGYDPSPQMVAAARRGVTRARFEVASLASLADSGATAPVVSAASLLAVLKDRAAALEALWQCVAPGGTLLLVETTARMRPGEVLGKLTGRRALGLLLWALVRRGRSAARDIESFRPPTLSSSTFVPLLGGTLGAWVLVRAPSSSRSNAVHLEASP